MKNLGPGAFRMFLLIALVITCLRASLAHEREHFTPIARNQAWNDVVTQIIFAPHESSHETLATELMVIQKFLSEHETEGTIGIYDVTVFKAIDQARARLQKADKDLEKIRTELSYKEYQAKLEK